MEAKDGMLDQKNLEIQELKKSMVANAEMVPGFVPWSQNFDDLMYRWQRSTRVQTHSNWRLTWRKLRQLHRKDCSRNYKERKSLEVFPDSRFMTYLFWSLSIADDINKILDIAFLQNHLDVKDIIAASFAFSDTSSQTVVRMKNLYNQGRLENLQHVIQDLDSQLFRCMDEITLMKRRVRLDIAEALWLLFVSLKF